MIPLNRKVRRSMLFVELVSSRSINYRMIQVPIDCVKHTNNSSNVQSFLAEDSLIKAMDKVNAISSIAEQAATVAREKAVEAEKVREDYL